MAGVDAGDGTGAADCAGTDDGRKAEAAKKVRKAQVRVGSSQERMKTF
jgi:hypothetical protein